MTRRTLPLLLATVAVAFGAAACGDDSTDPAGTDATLPDVPATDAPPVTEPDSVPGSDPDAGPGDPDGYDHPTGADDVVFLYAELGGFVPREFAFQATPAILVSGDGRMFTQGPQIAIYPGPLLPNVQVQTITDAGIQQLLAAADQAGLLAEVEYSDIVNVADASTAVVRVTVAGTTFVHEAYALGFEEPGTEPTEGDEARSRLAGFLAALQSGAIVDAAELGAPEAFVADSYQIEAVVIEDPSLFAGDGIEPTIAEWPAAAGVRLADATRCVDVPASEVGDALNAANQLTFFSDGGVTYQVFARPVLPGVTCPG